MEMELNIIAFINQNKINVNRFNMCNLLADGLTVFCRLIVDKQNCKFYFFL